jgi:small-conductance mechanosensitive channel/CRP-like cAMP-binding protein
LEREWIVPNADMPSDFLGQFLYSLTGLADVVAAREMLLALAALVMYLATAPKGRRWLSWVSIVLLGLGLVALLAKVLFPAGAAAEARPHAHHMLQFFLVASLLQSLLLIGAVSVWERVSAPMPKIFLDVLRCLMFALALLMVLWEAGINAGELITGSALVTAVLGFALKDTLGNVFAGLAIHAEHPFEVGDWIQYDAISAHIGKVVEINWRATKVITLDEAYVIIPNGQLAQASIRNFTKPEPWSRRSLFVVTPYDVSPQRVQRIILDAIRGSFGVLEHPAPSVVTNDFKERGVEHWVRLFTTDFDKRDRVDGMARDRIWFALARNGIDIPVATQAIRLTPLPPPAPPDPPEIALHRRLQSLEQVGLLDVLGKDHLENLAMQSRELRFAGGEPIIRQGDPGESMFVVLSGTVEVTAAEDGLGPVALAHLGPGDFFGEMSLMTGAARSATVTAVTETQVVEVDKVAFRGILAAEPSLVAKISDSLSTRLGERSRALAASGRPAAVAPQDLFQKVRDFFAM